MRPSEVARKKNKVEKTMVKAWAKKIQGADEIETNNELIPKTELLPASAINQMPSQPPQKRGTC